VLRLDGVLQTPDLITAGTMSVSSILFEENKPVIVSTNAYIRSSATITIPVLFINALDVAATSAAMTSSTAQRFALASPRAVVITVWICLFCGVLTAFIVD
jgi:hypothetical protein